MSAETAFRINIEKDVVPAVGGQPTVERDGLALVGAGMAEEYPCHPKVAWSSQLADIVWMIQLWKLAALA